jgi:transcriptional regulator with XRE-family HTH domain
MPAMVIGRPMVHQGISLGQPMNGRATIYGMREMRERTPFGERLFTARTHAKLTQAQLAKAAGISQGTLGELEYDGEASMAVVRLATACKVRPEWLAEGQGEMVDTFTWPFRRVPRERVLALSPDDLSYVEGKLEAALERCETGERTAKSAAPPFGERIDAPVTTKRARKV